MEPVPKDTFINRTALDVLVYPMTFSSSERSIDVGFVASVVRSTGAFEESDAEPTVSAVDLVWTAVPESARTCAYIHWFGCLLAEHMLHGIFLSHYPPVRVSNAARFVATGQQYFLLSPVAL